MFKGKMIHVIWSVLLSLPLIGFSAPHLQASDGAVEDTGQASGEKPFIMLLCKFPDIPDEQHTVAYYQDIMDNTYPGLDHFWQENSYGKLTMAGNQVAGWFTLPERHSRYVKKNGSVNGAKLKEDCANAADADVYFPDFYGINWMFNGRLGGVNLFSSTVLSLDGVTKTYPGTVIGGSSDPRSHTMGSLAHEEGHIWGFPHSYGPYGDSYDSKWDVMSYGGSCDPYDPVYYCIPSHTIAKHKMDAGWISQDRVFYATPGLVQTVTIERHALPTSNQDPLIAKVPIPHSKDFYTVESRKKAGYDIRIPGEAVVIHFKDHTQSGTLVVDPDGNGDPNDAGAMWLPGETFEDPANGVSITVNSDTGTGYNVTFDVVDLGYPDFTASDVSGPSTGAQGNLISVASTICNFGSVDWND
ncbi:MAG TPA: hypothetical protein VLB09_00345, partial [Nitrospiria bacterium]|nr:hypothetical protein [Nitrospiria bacterium]